MFHGLQIPFSSHTTPHRSVRRADRGIGLHLRNSFAAFPFVFSPSSWWGKDWRTPLLFSSALVHHSPRIASACGFFSCACECASVRVCVRVRVRDRAYLRTSCHRHIYYFKECSFPDFVSPPPFHHNPHFQSNLGFGPCLGSTSSKLQSASEPWYVQRWSFQLLLRSSCFSIIITKAQSMGFHGQHTKCHIYVII